MLVGLFAAVVAFSFTGCSANGAASFAPGAVYVLAPDSDEWGMEPKEFRAKKDAAREKVDADDVEKKPGFRRTLVGNFADLGALIVGLPFYIVLGYPAICVSDDAEMGQTVVYPFCVLGGAVVAAPIVALKFVFYDLPDGIGWLLTTDKGKAAYYISNIDDLSESEYLHLVELTGRDLGDVSRYRNMLYSYGVADKKACELWRGWWKENRKFSLEEIRARSKSEERTGGGPEAPPKDEGSEGTKEKEEEPDYGYE
jgi:hypothetical protein